MAWVVLMFVWVLGRTFSIVSYTHASLFELNDCHPTATSAISTIICLTKKLQTMQEHVTFWVYH